MSTSKRKMSHYGPTSSSSDLPVNKETSKYGTSETVSMEGVTTPGTDTDKEVSTSSRTENRASSYGPLSNGRTSSNNPRTNDHSRTNSNHGKRRGRSPEGNNNHSYQSNARNTRRRVNDPREGRIQESLLHLTDARSCEDLVTIITANDELTVFFTTLFPKCISQVSTLSKTYAVLTGLLNVKDAELGGSIIEKMTSQLQEDFKSFMTAEAEEVEKVCLRLRLVCHYLCHCVQVDVVNSADVLQLLKNLMVTTCGIPAAASPLHASNVAALRTSAWQDYICRIVLECLLYTYESLHEKEVELVATVMETCAQYMTVRQKGQTFVFRTALELMFFPEEDTLEEENKMISSLDRIGILWELVQKHSEIQDDLPKDSLSSLIPLCQRPAKIHPVPLVTPGDVLEATISPPHDSYYRLLEEDSGPQGALLAALPSATHYWCRTIIEDGVVAYWPKKTAACHHLLSLPRTFTAVFPNATDTPWQTLIVETLLMQILHPKKVTPAVYTSFVLFLCIQEQPGTFSPAAALTIELAFRRIGEMDAFTLDQFVIFFSTFLANFEFQWSWAHWNDYVAVDEEDPQRIFLSSVIGRCVRLSYAGLLTKKLPEMFHVLLPPPARTSVVAYEKEDAVYSAVEDMIVKKTDENEMKSWLEKQDDGEEAFKMISTALFASMNNATVSAVHATIDRYQILLTELVQEANRVDILIATLLQVWQNSPHHIEVMMGWMLRRGVITPLHVVKWCLTDVQQFSWPYIWTLITQCCLRAQSFATMAAGNSNVDLSAQESLQKQYEIVLETVMDGLCQLLVTHYKVDHEETWLINTLRRWKAFGRLFQSDLHSFFDSKKETISDLPKTHPVVRMYMTLCCGAAASSSMME